MGAKLKKNNAANMGPKERIVKITRRLEHEKLGPKMKAKLLARLVMLQKKAAESTTQQGAAIGFGKQPAFPKLAMRLAAIEEKLKTEEDAVRRADLEQRKANVQSRLAEKQEQQATKQCKNIKQRLSNIKAKLEIVKNPAVRANLEERKANLEAKLANKEKKDTSRGEVGSADEQWMKVDAPEPQAKEEEIAPEDQKMDEDTPKADKSFSSDAAGNGDIADMLGATLDKCAEAIDAMVAEFDRTSLDGQGAPMESKTAAEVQEEKDASKLEVDEELIAARKEEDASSPEVDPQLRIAFPKVTQRLINISRKLKTATNEIQRQNLLQRKAKVEAELARKQEIRRMGVAEAKKEDPCPGLDARKEEDVSTPEVDPQLRIAFPKVTQRLINISRKLKTVTNESQRKGLLQRKAKVEAELAKKQEKLVKDPGKSQKEDPCPGLDAEKEEEEDASAPKVDPQLRIAFPKVTQRLINISRKLETVTNESQRQNLLQRKTKVEAELARKQESLRKAVEQEEVCELNIDEKLIAAFPSVAKRLINISSKLKTNEGQRQNLLQRKVEVEAELARKQESLRKDGAEANKDGVCPGLDTKNEEEEDVSAPEVDPLLRIAFPKVTKRLINIARKLRTATNESQRQELLQRKAKVEAELARKQEQQLRNRAMNNGPFPGINRKMATIDAQLKSETDEAKRTELEKRKALLLVKLMEKRQVMDACPGGQLSRQVERTQELLGEATNAERRCSLESRLLHFQQRQEEASQSSHSSSASYDPRRAKQKQKFIQMEHKARINKNTEVLNRIALQQVYVGHYPDPQNYVSAFGGNKGIKKRAALRAQALELAQSQEGVKWIAADMYERLPQQWSLDDEVAMFGDKQKQGLQKNKNTKKSAGKNQTEEDFVAVLKEEDVMSLDDISEKLLPEYWSGYESGVLEDGFEKVMLDANVDKAVKDEGWMEVDNKEANLPAVSNKSKKNNEMANKKHG